MKLCVIIGCHPSTPERTKVLEDCIASFRYLNLPIIASSHTLPTETSADYYVYTKTSGNITPEEIFEIQRSESQHVFYAFEGGCCISHSSLFEQLPSYHFDALENVRNGMKFAKNLGYTHCIVSDGDNIFSETDLEVLMGHIGDEENALFYRGHEKKLNAFSSLIYFTEIDFFMDRMHQETKEAYVEKSKEIGEYTLEKHYFSAFLDSGAKIIPAIEFNLIDIFTTSAMDSLTSIAPEGSINLYVDKHDRETVYYFAYNAIGSLRVFNDEEMVLNILADRLHGWEYGKVETSSWKGTLRFEHVCNGITKHLTMDQETWKKHLSLNYIQFSSNI